jgi:hypothetical protein
MEQHRAHALAQEHDHMADGIPRRACFDRTKGIPGLPGRNLRSQPVAVLPENSNVRIAPMRRFPLEPLPSGVQDARIAPT